MAVYTPLTNEQIAEIIEGDYDIGQLQFAVGITQGVENTNYLVATEAANTTEQKFILTLYEKRVKEEDLPFFVELMQHLATHGIACPQPITRRDGKLLGIIADRPAALVSFLHGKSRTVIKNAHVASVGEALAELHRAVADFKPRRPNTLSLDGWVALYAKIQGQLDRISPGLESLVADEINHLQRVWPTLPALPQGVIHADLFPDNVFFEGDDVSGVIDFYFACSERLAYDVAITLNAWCFEPRHEFNPVKSKLLLNHYQKKRPFNRDEMEAFPTLLRGAALRFLLTRAYDWLHHEPAALVTPKNPMEYAAKLRFHQQIKAVDEYGF